VDALLKAQHAATPLISGTVVVGVDDLSLRMRLTVDGHQARCEQCDDSTDLSTNAPEMTRLLFGPLPPSSVMPLADSARILSAWCPLPLGISPQDKV